MQVNVKNLVSMTEANQNFSRVAKMVDESGTAVILKNNKPRYVVIEYSRISEQEKTDIQTVENVAQRILQKHTKAFEELAK
jgi:Phd_YefM.